MDCPRCGVPNLPGLPSCVDCGQDLQARPQAPARFVPEVAVANPLREQRARPQRPRPGLVASGLEHVGRLRHLPWQAFAQGSVGVVTGSVPGLLPVLRREWGAAALQLGLFLGAVAAVLLLGGGLLGLASHSWVVACGWSFSPASECQRRMNVPQPFRTVTAFWLVLPPTLILALALPIALAPLVDPVFHYGMAQSLLPPGDYVVDDDAMDTLVVGELVLLDRSDVAEREQRFRQLVGGEDEPWSEDRVGQGLARYREWLAQFAVFPVVVVALEGQRLGWRAGALTVDGVPSDATPVHTWPLEPLASDLRDVDVPLEQVAVWDWVPFPEGQQLHVVLVPRERLLGRITKRGQGQDEPERVPWPPADPQVLEVL